MRLAILPEAMPSAVLENRRLGGERRAMPHERLRRDLGNADSADRSTACP